MMTHEKEMAIQKIIEMHPDRVSKVLIFMAGMEAEHIIDKKNEMATSEGGKKDVFNGGKKKMETDEQKSV